MPPNNRRYTRYPVRLRVQYQDTDREMVIESQDLSLGGMFLSTSNPAVPGTLVRISLQLPESLGQVGAAGLVVHCIPGRGMGIEFKTFSPGAKARLQFYIDTFGS
jgi:hypothetical protein